MPLYCYLCSACGHHDEEFQHMQDNALTHCPVCKEGSYRKQVTLPHTDMKEFHTPIEMYSIALNSIDEVNEFQRRCPDVEVCRDPRDEMFGIPVARTRKQKLAALDAMGFEEKNRK